MPDVFTVFLTKDNDDDDVSCLWGGEGGGQLSLKHSRVFLIAVVIFYRLLQLSFSRR